MLTVELKSQYAISSEFGFLHIALEESPHNSKYLALSFGRIEKKLSMICQAKIHYVTISTRCDVSYFKEPDAQGQHQEAVYVPLDTFIIIKIHCLKPPDLNTQVLHGYDSLRREKSMHLNSKQYVKSLTTFSKHFKLNNVSFLN